MTYSYLDPVTHNNVAGETVDTQLPPTQKQIRTICFFLHREVRLR